MIVKRGDEEFVELDFQDVNGGVSTLMIPMDMFLLFLRQSRTFVDLRVLSLGWPVRRTANANRKADRTEEAAVMAMGAGAWRA